jgi:hypothetical protein
MKISRKQLKRLILQEIKQGNQLNEVFLTGPVIAAIMPAIYGIAGLLGYSYLNIETNISRDIANDPEIIERLKELGHEIKTDMERSPAEIARQAAASDPLIKELIEKIEAGYVSEPVSNLMDRARKYNPMAYAGADYRGDRSLSIDED